jgi:hypothetical protein
MSVPREQLAEWKAKLLKHGHGWDGYAVDVVGVIDELLTLRAENERLREALGAYVALSRFEWASWNPTLADLERRAAAALAKEGA